jgi:hypothetical protein
MSGDASDSSDEWGMEELDLTKAKISNNNKDDADEDADDNNKDEDYWKVEPTHDNGKEKDDVNPPKPHDEGSPMIIVDVTKMNPSIHSKHDRNSVNDIEGASKMKKKLEAEYDAHAKDSDLLADGTVIPCGSSVWRAALVRLRDERPGHYFVPVFPPKKK